jgi:hypothetical protein
MTPEEYERRPEVKAALKLVRSRPELLRTSGWASYAHRLMDALGVPPAERKYKGGWQMPVEYQYAYKRAVSGWSRNDAFDQVVAPAIKSGKPELSGRFARMALLEVFEELTGLYPTLMLVDQTKPDEGPFSVKDVLEGFRFTLEREEVPIQLRSFLQAPHWIWGMEGLGFVSIWAMPEGEPMRLAFKEHEGGLPVGRPPFTQ